MKSSCQTTRLALLMLWVFLPLNGANAALTDSTTFNVKINIDPTCDIKAVSASDVDFGSHGHDDTNIDAQGDLTIKCTNGTAYSIGLDNGLHFDNGNTVRQMSGIGAGNTGELIPYTLYLNANHSTEWTTASPLSGTGTGQNEVKAIYGQVANLTNAKAGQYLDTVTATVTY